MTISLTQRFIAALIIGILPVSGHAAIGLFGRHYSPLDSERPIRPRTDYIILHTTEGPAQGSYEELFRYGEAHFLVDQSGRVYMIIRKEKVARHAGRSMWNGKQDLDNCSISIETVGHYNQTQPDAQYVALKRLLDSLKRAYRISDDRVLTHSMIAYGEANRWFSRAHRGRKRCGMLFADPATRTRIGLYSQPSFDPDVAAGRLAIGDAYLARMLYPGPSLPKKR